MHKRIGDTFIAILVGLFILGVLHSCSVEAHDQEYYHKHKSECHFDRYTGKYICYFD